MVTFGGLSLPHALVAESQTGWVENQMPIPGRNVAYRFNVASLGRTVQVTGEIREATISGAYAWIECLRHLNDGVARSLDLEDGETPAFTAKMTDPEYNILVGGWFPGKYHVPYGITFMEAT